MVKVNKLPYRRPQRASDLVVKNAHCVIYPLWFKCYKNNFVTWNVSNINYTNYIEKDGLDEQVVAGFQQGATGLVERLHAV
jgi:hypothetical protein